jgi:hypothetical protein
LLAIPTLAELEYVPAKFPFVSLTGTSGEENAAFWIGFPLVVSSLSYVTFKFSEIVSLSPILNSEFNLVDALSYPV